MDGVDVTENSVAGGANFRTIVPINIESIEEFRVAVSNPNATFGRSAGGQVALVGRRGSNDFHGAVYWYHQNDNLNANSWTNNRNNIAKAETRDNRGGFRVGGPIWPNKMFFFANYEAREFPRNFNTSRLVPSSTMRNGQLRFRDATGAVVTYNLIDFDPRGIGISPAITSLWSLMPAGNDPTGAAFGDSGDGLNTEAFRSTAGAPQKTDYYVFRYDYNITNNYRFNGSYTYWKDIQTLGDNDGARQQLDIRGGTAAFTGQSPFRGTNLTLGLDGQITPTLNFNFTFGYLRDRNGTLRFDPSGVASLLAIPGTDSAAGAVALNLGGGFDAIFSEPIDTDTQRARTQSNDNENYQFVANGTWVKGKHTFQFGTHDRILQTRHTRNDKVIGSLSALLANLDDGSFLDIPAGFRPPTCGGAVTTNCLTTGDVSDWNRMYAAALGMIDNIGILAARDGALQPLPFGTPLALDTQAYHYEFYFQDVWRVNQSFTLTLGLAYSWQTPPKDTLDRQTLLQDVSTGEIFTFQDFMHAKAAAAFAGDTFNPNLGFIPIAESGRSGIHRVDRDNWGPRIAAAWSPSFTSGFGGALFGDRKTVIRGGFSLVYDRINTVQSVIIPMLGVGFGQTLTLANPRCNATGAGGTGCNAGAATDPERTFRVGVDGSLPVPAFGPATSPVVPTAPFAEILSFQMDPDFDVGENYSFDLTWQRELPANMVMEVGYLGRLGRRLPTSGNLNTSPFFHVDLASGQTFAEAFDAVAAELRAGTLPADVTLQEWFENQDPSGTVGRATAQTSAFINGDISALFLQIDFARFGLGLPTFNHLPVSDLFLRTSVGRSNYHGLVAILRKRMSQGLTFDLNYTFSRCLDQGGTVQNSANYLPNSFFPFIEYGPCRFDRTHVFNGTYFYELPFGRGRAVSTGNWADKLIGGWYFSGIFRASSGRPLFVSHGVAALGGGNFLPSATGALTGESFENETHPAPEGSDGLRRGLNYFSDPAAALAAFRRIALSVDGRTGRANPLRHFPVWGLDVSLGKKTSITETVSVAFSFDFFNIFNHANFSEPSLSLTSPSTFGNVTSQLVPANRQEGSRWIQFGIRVEF